MSDSFSELEVTYLAHAPGLHGSIPEGQAGFWVIRSTRIANRQRQNTRLSGPHRTARLAEAEADRIARQTTTPGDA
jgi:hypothetical protein